jgi:ATP-binding cassette subfamily B protein
MNLLQGKITFLIGESGCGKSTVCKILEKFYAQESGEIIINDTISLASLATDQWREIDRLFSQPRWDMEGLQP